MNVSLTPELEKLVNEKVASGQYQTASEVVREGLRLLEERDEIRERKLEKLRREIDIGIKQADAGRTKPLDVEDMKRRIREYAAQHKKAKKA